jgi:uncharacterized membrane protein YedE/YeeE
LIADILLAAGAFGAAAYCYILAGRLKRFTTLENGMGGAIAVGFFAFAIAKKRTVNFFGGALHLPKSNQIDKPLVIGAVLFGAGWGLAGFCPGPGLVSLASGNVKGAFFVAFMLVGMQLFEIFNRITAKQH